MASLSVDANYEVAVYTSVRFALSHVPASVWAVVCGIGSVLCLTQAWLLRQYATAIEELPILSAREAAHQVWSAWKTRYTVLIHEYCQSYDVRRITNIKWTVMFVTNITVLTYVFNEGLMVFHTPIEQQIMTALKQGTEGHVRASAGADRHLRPQPSPTRPFHYWPQWALG